MQDRLARWERQEEKGGLSAATGAALEAGRALGYHSYFPPWIYGHRKSVLMGFVFRKLKRLVMPFQNT